MNIVRFIPLNLFELPTLLNKRLNPLNFLNSPHQQANVPFRRVNNPRTEPSRRLQDGDGGSSGGRQALQIRQQSLDSRRIGGSGNYEPSLRTRRLAQ